MNSCPPVVRVWPLVSPRAIHSSRARVDELDTIVLWPCRGLRSARGKKSSSPPMPCTRSHRERYGSRLGGPCGEQPTARPRCSALRCRGPRSRAFRCALYSSACVAVCCRVASAGRFHLCWCCSFRTMQYKRTEEACRKRARRACLLEQIG